MNIKLENIKKEYKGRVVLDIDYHEFKTGCIYAIAGPNGSGKSTLLKLICGLIKPDHGKIYYDDCTAIDTDISYMPQKPYIFDMSVLDNVMLGLGKGQDKIKMAEEALIKLDMLQFKDSEAKALSGGEAQRVAAARTLVSGKRLLLLDEPASAADILSVRYVEEYIKLVNNISKASVIFTTHNPSQALRTADEAVILWEGRIIESGPSAEVIKKPRSEQAKLFLQNWRL